MNLVFFMSYKKILLTGSTGKLGKAILRAYDKTKILSPKRDELDLTNKDQMEKYFSSNDFGVIIHCAALSKMVKCEEDPVEAIRSNIVGTSNLVEETLKKEKSGNKIRFLYISTDGVYPGVKGNYSEKDAAIPCSKYGWTKLGGECSVNLLNNFCIIRTSFFDKERACLFDDAPSDMYESKLEIEDLVNAIIKLINSSFVGTINIGGKKKSRYELFKKFNSSLKESKFKDVQKSSKVGLAKDSSMNLELWNKLKDGLD